MTVDHLLKNQLHRQCLELVQEKIGVLQQRSTELNQLLGEESKSSVGDKYETGRSMLHLEIEKCDQQLAQIINEKVVLDQISSSSIHDSVKLGALSVTDHGNYYLSIGLGPVTVNEMEFFLISPASPIGKAMMGLSTGDSLEFRGKVITVNQVL